MKITFELKPNTLHPSNQIKSNVWLHKFTGTDDTIYAYIGPKIHPVKGRFIIEALADTLEKNQYGQVRIKKPKYVKHPSIPTVPPSHLSTIRNLFDKYGWVHPAISKEWKFEYAKRDKILNELNEVGSMGGVEVSRPVAKLKSWVIKNAFELKRLPLINHKGEVRWMKLKLHISGRIAVEDGNYQPRKMTDKGTYVIYKKQRWYIQQPNQ